MTDRQDTTEEKQKQAVPRRLGCNLNFCHTATLPICHQREYYNLYDVNVKRNAELSIGHI